MYVQATETCDYMLLGLGNLILSPISSVRIRCVGTSFLLGSKATSLFYTTLRVDTVMGSL